MSLILLIASRRLLVITSMQLEAEARATSGAADRVRVSTVALAERDGWMDGVREEHRCCDADAVSASAILPPQVAQQLDEH